MISEEVSQAALTCALRFDAYAWLETLISRPSNDLNSFSDSYAETLTPFAVETENFAAFFALQRWLHKWGGETQPETARDWLAYWQLFLNLWSRDVPPAFRSIEYDEQWRSLSDRIPVLVAEVRRHVLETFGGLRPQFVEPWWLPPKVNKQQLGRYAEHFVKLEFLKAGKEIFATEVDDRGIDLVVRLSPTQYLPVQVKAARTAQVIFLNKLNFSQDAQSLLALVDFTSRREPEVFLIPAMRWINPVEENARFLCSWRDKAGVDFWQLYVDNKSLISLRRDFRLETTLSAMAQRPPTITE